MGNSIGGKRRTAKVMKIDGTSFRVKPPVRAGDVVREYPGHDVLESEEVKQLGVRARPLDADSPLKPGRLYFLVALPRLPLPPDRAWSGALRVGARERLEGLMLARRSSSDISFLNSHAAADSDSDAGLRLRLRLPKAEVARLMHESSDAADAARKIMDLCVAGNRHPLRTPDRGTPTPIWTPDRGTPTPIWTPDRGTPTPLRTPDRGTPTPIWTPDRGTPTPIWTPDRGTPTPFRTPDRGTPTPLRTPDRGTPVWTPDRSTPTPTPLRTPDRGTPTGRKEKRTRFADLPDEKMGDYSTELLAYAMQV